MAVPLPAKAPHTPWGSAPCREAQEPHPSLLGAWIAPRPQMAPATLG